MSSSRYRLADNPDLDLVTEDVRLADGTRLTDQLAEEISAEILSSDSVFSGRE